ncbi:MAG: sulfurtransferase TusA family protein [Candidatus Acidiferrales bacterium]|jgi:tRNA 2-thiouridine synthesizing protein A
MDEWNAGDMGCGELLIELAMRMKQLAPGQVLELTALDPGAVEDIPAWCGLTGHALVSARHPVYQIRRRNN